jgi:hypothetical protein
MLAPPLIEIHSRATICLRPTNGRTFGWKDLTIPNI